ncbi:hypothetical protein XAC3562_210247 [Xanthomonas citri pv. citri]|uniref:Uncharacterized protein n=1 Tax=Xanthomonas citri pv. citri TaxID=611301 RepID=A0A0U5FBX4_XANCI|nr:hypothetical protein XAC3562_210247 [Xanthomonas citri pv. citri]CEH45147.1 hypothetical protein XACLG97_3310005 [Xanthomonas citri pv. citri]CEH47402.1 hypothetical protein XACG102_3280010 [Xanthomonas citri pv. citri]CEH62021.1 hypothetical protein XACLD7_4560038 [Xanthomonas citri pv. citri]CEH92227.1 hypothetical protein XACLH37_630064 [Xanthomonas citri pv. citri]
MRMTSSSISSLLIKRRSTRVLIGWREPERQHANTAAKRNAMMEPAAISPVENLSHSICCKCLLIVVGGFLVNAIVWKVFVTPNHFLIRTGFVHLVQALPNFVDNPRPMSYHLYIQILLGNIKKRER